MRNTINSHIVSLVAFILIPSIGFGQAVLQKRITVSFQNTTYVEALESIGRLADVDFFYSNDYLPDETITISFEDEPLQTVLNKLFKDTKLTYSVSGKDITIKLTINPIKRQPFTISGRVTNLNSGEHLFNAHVYERKNRVGTTTNQFGFYSITLPEGQYIFEFSYFGQTTVVDTVMLNKNLRLDVNLEDREFLLPTLDFYDSVYIKGKSHQTPEDPILVTPLFLKRSAPVFGETEPIRSLIIGQPGFLSGGEGSTALHVRGGGADQNLILYDGAPVYNAGHMLNFFSIFNPDLIKEIEIHKGGIPAKYGGRLSSVLDIRAKEGNKNKRIVSGGLSNLSGRLTVEQPFAKGKGSLLLAGRRTYFDLLLDLIQSNLLAKNKNTFHFYDLNAKINYELNDRNTISVSTYFGEDKLSFKKLFGTRWTNQTGTVRWIKNYNDKLFSNVTFFASNFSAESEVNLVSNRFGYIINYSLRDIGIKADFDYIINPFLTLKFGGEATHHKYFFGEISPSNPASIVEKVSLNPAFAFERATYLSVEANLKQGIHAELGLRYSWFDNLGKANVYLYDTTGVLEPETVVDTIQINTWKSYFRHQGFEPRLALRYIINDKNFVKATFDITRQYLHQLSNTNTPSPVDMWAPVNPYIKPQIATQYSLGYFRNINKHTYEVSVAGYLKKLQNQIDFKPQASLLLNNHLETEVFSGTGLSYGMEFLFKKSKGKFSGWINYTWSKATRQINGINRDKAYPTSFDRNHNLATVLSLQLGKRVLLSINWNYASGIAYSFPVGKYEKDGVIVPYYTSRNGFRLPPTHHLDLSLTVFREMSEDRMNESSFSFSIYNVYNRKNTYAYVFRQSDINSSQTETVKLYLFPFVPSFNYNFKF